MTTKEKILGAALQLYNAKGTDVITIRHIAKEIGISHGNLQYHYKNTEELILALFGQLSSEMDQLMTAAAAPAIPSFHAFRQDLQKAFTIFYKYRFIFLHFVAIVQRVPEIKTRYNSMDEFRGQQFSHMFASYREMGIFRNDIPTQIWKELISLLYITSDFWLAHNEIKLGLQDQAAVDHYVQLISNMFYPYLTEKGVATWQAEK
ncbi:TetR/AcrR family transcriptional regulator [Chitinophaga sp. Cy-1792]|uniref:TetR/AcrR family transcriptional regulator n=1 Tax=Chitinophaga sp. Cy-1792 TaxID=2608339 RepID=UPI00141E4CD7|nr:TetR/AcrR family transcriptional regulator [Chitinophaga sp. Cy-1792]NIG56450.1 TetR/AcrR family transcriptional regulator [Chitinophaga sp. Cy-1792]